MKWVVFLACLFAITFSGYSAQALTIYTEDAPPYNFIGTDGKPAGLCYEVVVEIQKRIGNRDPISMVPWARGLNELDTKPNVLLFATNRTAERNPRYQWIGPVGENTFGFYSKATANFSVSSLEEAKKVPLIGVYLDDVRDQVLTSKGFKNLDRSNNLEIIFKKLMDDRVALIASSQDEIRFLAEKVGFRVSDIKLQSVFLRVQIYIAASRGTPVSVVKKWNETLDSMKKDGSFKKIFKKYFPNSPLPGSAITRF